MTSRRTAKAAEAIRETVSTTVLFGLKDPRIKGVTVLSVEAAGDLRSCKVYVSIMGTPKQQSLAMHGLRAARGFLQAKLADRLQTRNTPVIEFVLDQGVKRSIEASRLLYESGTDFSVPLDTGEGGAEAGAPVSQGALADEELDENALEDDELDAHDFDEDEFEDDELEEDGLDEDGLDEDALLDELSEDDSEDEEEFDEDEDSDKEPDESLSAAPPKEADAGGRPE